MKLIFCGKNEAQISGFAVVKKALKKKNFFSKKNSSSLFLQNGVRKLFKNKWVSRYLKVTPATKLIFVTK